MHKHSSIHTYSRTFTHTNSHTHTDGNDPTHGLCSAMAKAFNIHPLELESVDDLTHTQPEHVKKARVQEQFLKQLAMRKEKAEWIRSTDAWKFANDGARPLMASYVGGHPCSHTFTHTLLCARAHTVINTHTHIHTQVDETGVTFVTNEAHDKVFRSAEESTRDMFEKRMLLIYLGAT